MPKVSESHRAGRRRQILDGARTVFARHGYEGATVARLEEQVGLSRGAIFNYFPSKRAIFYALAQEDLERALRLLLDRDFGAVLRMMNAESPEWLAVYLEFMRMLRTDPGLRAEWANRSPELIGELAEHLGRQQQRGELRSDVSVEAIGTFLGLVADGAAVHISAGYPIDVESVVRLVGSAIERPRARPAPPSPPRPPRS